MKIICLLWSQLVYWIQCLILCSYWKRLRRMTSGWNCSEVQSTPLFWGVSLGDKPHPQALENFTLCCAASLANIFSVTSFQASPVRRKFYKTSSVTSHSWKSPTASITVTWLWSLFLCLFTFSECDPAGVGCLFDLLCRGAASFFSHHIIPHCVWGCCVILQCHHPALKVSF